MYMSVLSRLPIRGTECAFGRRVVYTLRRRGKLEFLPSEWVTPAVETDARGILNTIRCADEAGQGAWQAEPPRLRIARPATR
jgi:hypothetical protein